jgi:ribonuclease G
MSRQILVNASHYETRVATLEDGEIRQLHIEREEDRNVVGNIYKGVVKRVLPGMQAAFLELGLERTAFLYVDDIIDEPFGTDFEVMDQSEEPVTEEDDSAFEPETYKDTGASESRSSRPRPPARQEAREEERGGYAYDDEAEEDAGADDLGPEEDRYYSERNDEEDRDDEGPVRAEGDDPANEGDDYKESPRPPRPQRGSSHRRSGAQASGPAGGRGGQRGGRRTGGRPQRRGRFSHRRPRGSANIQDLLKEGQEILVQVAKAPIGTKGARLTTHISLPGRNLVLMPTVKHLGISRRIGSDRERRRLRDIFTKKIRPKDVGFIIRTVAEGKSYRDIRADADYLMRLWDQINHDSKKKRAPALIHEDLSLGMRAVRDFFTEDVDSFIVDNSHEYEHVLDFVGEFMPRLQPRVKLFKGPSQLFEHYGIEAEISRALGKKVWLKSGGYLLIDQSEALTAIDVNTGRYVGSKSLEETILKTNLEAVKEIAYQLRIRNVGGIIIIDLIDMESLDNREKVYQALSEALGEDRAKTNILKISELGLVEMTRKRTHEDLVRYLTESCSHCDGRGYHKSRRTVCFEIFREIEKEGLSSNKNIIVFAHPNVVTRMTVEEKEHVKILEKRFDKNIVVNVDPAFHMEQYEVYGRAY